LDHAGKVLVEVDEEVEKVADRVHKRSEWRGGIVRNGRPDGPLAIASAGFFGIEAREK
jgi:hypothetical protein